MRKFFFKLHLWLGLASGIVVFIVCITGCLYVFKDEITAISKPWLRVESQEKATLKPTELTSIAAKAVSNSQPSAITYGEKTDAVWVDLNENQSGTFSTVYMNPYTGKILHISKKKLGEFDFFDFLLKGHTTLWLPRSVGKIIVGYGVLLFLITLLTGLFIWFPKRWNKKILKNKFTFHRPFRAKRLMLDLHSILGMYILIPLLSASFTGLIFAFEWFSSGVYAVMSGGKELVEYEMPKSDSFVNQTSENTVDIVYKRITKEEPNAVQVYYALPQSDSDVLRVSVVHEKGSYYKQDNRFFEMDAAKEIFGRGVYTGRYNEKTFAEKAIRMNLDIHEGRIFGFFGKIIMCIASFFGASLPITGLLLYIRRKKVRIRD